MFKNTWLSGPKYGLTALGGNVCVLPHSSQVAVVDLASAPWLPSLQALQVPERSRLGRCRGSKILHMWFVSMECESLVFKSLIFFGCVYPFLLDKLPLV